jgi:alpha-N-arabinofuranosidase
VKGKVGEEIGISNPGYWGIDILPQTYKGSFWAFGDYRGDFKAALRSASSGEILTSVNIPSHSNTRGWTKHEFVLDSDIAAGYKTNFTLTFVAKSRHQALNFNLISLFPPTYNNRENGLRRDLMQSLKDLNPSFMRIPGGNNLQGKVPGSRWKWNETIGDLIDRSGRTGAWRYYNTDGLGLIEYMLVSNLTTTAP